MSGAKPPLPPAAETLLELCRVGLIEGELGAERRAVIQGNHAATQAALALQNERRARLGAMGYRIEAGLLAEVGARRLEVDWLHRQADEADERADGYRAAADQHSRVAHAFGEVLRANRLRRMPRESEPGPTAEAVIRSRGHRVGDPLERLHAAKVLTHDEMLAGREIGRVVLTVAKASIAKTSQIEWQYSDPDGSPGAGIMRLEAARLVHASVYVPWSKHVGLRAVRLIHGLAVEQESLDRLRRRDSVRLGWKRAASIVKTALDVYLDFRAGADIEAIALDEAIEIAKAG